MSRVVTELIVIRHGQTDLNREPRFQGQIDVPLNPLGLRQAQRLSERLAAERIDTLVSSDLVRARQTAAPTAELRHLSPELSEALREQAFGVFEGLSFPEVMARHPDAWTRWLRHEPDDAPPGGESAIDFHARVVGAVRSLAREHAGRTLALVTHGGVLDMLWRTAHGMPLRGARACAIPNAGLNRLRIVGESIEIVGWADDAHVADLSG